MIALILLALPSMTHGQGTGQTGTVQLSLTEAVEEALRLNLSVRLSRFDLSIAEEDVSIARGEFDPILSLTARNTVVQRSSSTSELDGAAGPRNETFNTRLGVSQKVDTGGILTLSTTLNRQETNSQFSLLNPAYNADMSLAFSQPLLRNFGTGVNRANRERSRRGLDRSKLLLVAEAEEVALQTELAFYQVAFGQRQLEVRRLGIELAEALLRESRLRREQGLATSLDELQAEVGVANAQSLLLVAEQTLRDAEERLLFLLGRENLGQTFASLRLLPTSPMALDPSTSYREATLSQPEFLAAGVQLQLREIDARVARRNRLPTLNLGGALGYTGQDRTWGRAYDEVPSGDGYNWQMDLTLSIPWGMREERARARQANLALEREHLRLHQFEQDLMVRIRAAIRAVETAHRRLEIASLATRLSQREYELERARFNSGLSTSRRVLDAQAAQDQARVNELQAEVDLRTARARVSRLEGGALRAHGLELKL